MTFTRNISHPEFKLEQLKQETQKHGKQPADLHFPTTTHLPKFDWHQFNLNILCPKRSLKSLNAIKCLELDEEELTSNSNYGSLHLVDSNSKSFTLQKLRQTLCPFV